MKQGYSGEWQLRGVDGRFWTVVVLFAVEKEYEIRKLLNHNNTKHQVLFDPMLFPKYQYPPNCVEMVKVNPIKKKEDDRKDVLDDIEMDEPVVSEIDLCENEEEARDPRLGPKDERGTVSIGAIPCSSYDYVHALLKKRYKIRPLDNWLKRCPHIRQEQKLAAEQEQIQRRQKQLDDLSINLPKSVGKLINIKRLIYEYAYECELEASIPHLWSLVNGYQRQGVRFVYERGGRAFLADDMGLGKTLQTILLTAIYRTEWPVLVVCVKAVVGNWQQEFAKWMGITDVLHLSDKKHLDRISVFEETDSSSSSSSSLKNVHRKRPLNADDKTNKKKQKLSEPQVIIVTCDLVARNNVVLQTLLNRKFKILVVDEAHSCKNIERLRSTAMCRLAEVANRVILLSGTTERPCEVYPMMLATLGAKRTPPRWVPEKELQQHIRGLTTPTKFHEYLEQRGEFTFVGRWCAPMRQIVQRGRRPPIFPVVVNGYSRLGELNAVMRVLFIIKRLKKDHLLLPDMIRAVIYCEPTSEMMQEFTRIRQKMSDALKHHRTEEFRFDFMSMYHHLPQLKSPYVVQHITHLFSPGGEMYENPDDAMIIFAHHKPMMEAIQKTLLALMVPYFVIDGSVSAKKRASGIAEFQDPKSKLRAAVISIQAGGAGINLHRANHVLFTEITCSPSNNLQAECRAHRLGQKKQVTSTYFLMKHSIEELLIAMIKKKFSESAMMMEGTRRQFEFDSETDLPLETSEMLSAIELFQE
jgi:SNF2 family DNA or RNA helicase